MNSWRIKLHRVSVGVDEAGRPALAYIQDNAVSELPVCDLEAAKQKIRQMHETDGCTVRTISVSANEKNTLLVYLNTDGPQQAVHEPGWVHRMAPRPPHE